MTRPVPQITLDFLKLVEGCNLTPYLDSTGHWTDGYGNALGVIPHGLPITQEIADTELAENAQIAAGHIAEVVDEAVVLQLTDHEYAALISFVFNLGCDKSWTIWKDLNNHQFEDVPDQLKRFDKGVINGKLQEIPGLDHRRLAEVTLWNTADVPAAVATAQAVPAPSSSVTRDNLVTPPTPAPKPALDLSSLVVKATTAVGSVGALASQLHDQIAPHADEVPAFQHAAVILTMVVVSCSVIALLIHDFQSKAAKV